VALHIGAHKTASTHLQASLNAAALDLAAAGVRFYGPDYLRKQGRTLPQMFGLAEAEARRPAPDQARFLAKDGHRIVLSEENFCGPLHDGRGQMAIPLYPLAEARVGALVHALNPLPVDLFVAIRDPARFVTSAYSQMLMGGHVMPFRAFRAANPFRRIGWAALIGRLRAVPGLRSLTVWQYEDYSATFGQIVWVTWVGFGRVLLPLSVISLLAILDRREADGADRGIKEASRPMRAAWLKRGEASA